MNIAGYAVKWADRARIPDRYYGVYVENVKRGAFARSIANRLPQVLFGHGHGGALADMPVAKVTSIREDEVGLRFEARMLPSAPGLLKEAVTEALLRCSIGFRPESDSWLERPKASKWNPDQLPQRTLERVELREISLVTFPAYPDASVGVADTAPTPRSQPQPVLAAKPAQSHVLAPLYGTPAYAIRQEALRRMRRPRPTGWLGEWPERAQWLR